MKLSRLFDTTSPVTPVGQFAACLIGLIAAAVASFSFGASAYCLVALTGVGGVSAKIGGGDCQSYFLALSALLTPTIAAAAALIAYQQHRTSRASLRHDLYERRAAVLRGVLAFLGAVLRDGTVKPGEIPPLASAISERRYLFERDLSDYLKEIYRNAVAVYTKELLFGGLPGGSPQRAALVEQHSDLVAWLIEQPEEVQGRFEQYLKIEA